MSGGSNPGARGGNSSLNHTATGRPAPMGAKTFNTSHGAVTQRPNGRISDVHDTAHGMDIHHGLDGGRRVMVDRPDHSRVFADRGRGGFIERPYRFHDHDYARRSYYWHGHEYPRFYRGYYYNGVMVNVYAPSVYFGVGFYGWAYNPWYTPVVYSWGWAGNPWYGYYGYYFVPSPVYAAPADWLTDYVISTNLSTAYVAQAAAPPAPQPAAAQPALTPEIKAQIADEVRAQIALENAEAQSNAQGQEPDPASSSINRTFADGKPHVFIANSSLDVVDTAGNECLLTDGDVLRTSGQPEQSADTATLQVVASKGGKECQTASSVMVAVADLQEMQNGLRATVDQGLQDLQSNQGKKGLPAAPRSAQSAPVQSAFAQAAPPAEVNGAAEIDRQLTAADQVDKETARDTSVSIDAAPAATAAPATINIAPGQTVAQVTAQLGTPASVTSMGAKKIYVYKDIKVIFREGKVVDVQ